MNSRYIMKIKWLTGLRKGERETRFPNILFTVGKTYLSAFGDLYLVEDVKERPDWKPKVTDEIDVV